MTPKVQKVKPNKEALKKIIKLPECEVKEGEVWYPPDEFLVYAHDIMIERYGYWSGFELGLEPYHHFIEEAKALKAYIVKQRFSCKEFPLAEYFKTGITELLLK